jgi:DNA polymerase I
MAEVTKKLAIIDGKSVFYRGYYAMPNLATKDGTPTGGVYGFATMALEVLKLLKPDYVCVAWDKPKTNIRKRLELYPHYKAGRKAPPPDFYAQIPLLHELLEAFGWPLYELDDYEADDIMGTLAFQAKDKGIDTALITSDLDMLQVINGNVHVYALKKGLSNIELYHPESFEKKYGITVEQFLDLKALKGDSSDNIPGVPGIGEKGALKLLHDHKTLDGIYENIELISGSTHDKLLKGKDSAYLSKELARIWVDAPIKLNLKEVDGSKCNPDRVAEVLQKLEFKSLVRQLPDVMKVSPDKVTTDQVSKDQAKIIPVNNSDELEKISIPKNGDMLFDAYCRGAHGRDPKYLLASFRDEDLYIIDCDKVPHEQLKRFFETTKHLGLVGHDIKSSIKAIYSLGGEVGPVKHDVLIASFLLNSLRREQTLTELAQVELGYGGPDLDQISPEEYLERAAVIASSIRALYAQQAKDLAAIPKLQDLAEKIELPVIPVLATMEYRGTMLDSEYLANFSEELKDSISDLEQQIYGYADQEFNISSPLQLSEILFVKLKLPTLGIKKGKTGYSTAANELDKLRALHPIIDLITQYREATKLMSTYVEALPKQVDEQGRLHTTFNMATAPTGRLSSVDPNLQNIPVRTELGNRIRTAFITQPNYVLISADYSQFELRLAAVLAKDQELIDMFNKDIDIHTATAAQVYGRELEDVTKTMRRDAKVINFGILYGMSPHGLSAATGMTFAAAKQFIDKYFELRKPILEYMNHLRESAKKQGYVETLFGRRRPMPDIHSTNFVVRQAAERAAINMPIQGTEADLMKMAMITIQEYLEDIGDAFMLLQIHDSILVEAPEDKAEEIAKKLKEIMEEVYKLPVKLTVDTHIGKNWGEL